MNKSCWILRSRASRSSTRAFHTPGCIRSGSGAGTPLLVSSPVVEVARELGMRLIGIRLSPDAPAGVFGINCLEGPAEQKPGRQTDAALLLLTSATTDLPKLVPWSRSNIRAMTAQDVRAFELGAADRFLSLLPLYSPHCLYSLFTQLSCGGSVFCPAFFEVAGVRAAFESIRPTWFSGTPAIHNAILSLARENPKFFRLDRPLRPLLDSPGCKLAAPPTFLVRASRAEQLHRDTCTGRTRGHGSIVHDICSATLKFSRKWAH